MKKSLIIALISVLLIGTFVACDGDVFADLIDKAPEVKRVITLSIKESDRMYFSFDDDTFEKVIDIPTDCTTWGDLVDEGISITVKAGSDAVTMPLIDDSGEVYYYLQDGAYYYGFIDPEPTSKYAVETVHSTDEIVIGGIYEIDLGCDA